MQADQFDTIITSQLVSEKPIALVRFALIFEMDYSIVKKIFCNGFQSWSLSREYSLDEKIKQPIGIFRKLMANYGDYGIINKVASDDQLYSWLYTYLKLPHKEVFWIGSLDESNGYTLFTFNRNKRELIIIKDCEGLEISNAHTILRAFYSKTNEVNAASIYFRKMKLVTPKVKPAIGWTSWYYYYTKISEQIILANINAYRRKSIPIDYFQIDDGYQKAVGDWMEVNEKFPGGLKPIVRKIKEINAKAGLWLAPLVCERKSSIVKNHPHWFVKGENGKKVKVGFNDAWSGWFYALDIYNEEVRAYLKQVFDKVLLEWEFDMVKLDFLFGAAIRPRNGKSRGAIMYDTMTFLRECIGDKIILGCGVPISSAVGLVDYCRIGPDVHLSWDFKALKWIRNKERPSNVNAILNSAFRRHLNGRAFLNDTDVFILRERKNKLSFNEKYTLLLSNILFGDLIFTSDNIAEYKKPIEEIYKSIFPLRKINQLKVDYSNGFFRIHFMIKGKQYLALINTSDGKRQYKLAEGDYFNCLTKGLVQGGEYIDLAQHQSFCFLRIEDTPFAIAGSIGHFFSGSEVSEFMFIENDIVVTIEENSLHIPTIFVKVPKDYTQLTVNGNKAEIFCKRNFNIYRIQFN